MAGCTGSQIKAAEESYSHGEIESTEAHLQSAIQGAGPDSAALALATADLGERRVGHGRRLGCLEFHRDFIVPP
jgi:hypothetical protein